MRSLGCLFHLISLTSLISAEEIKNKCKNEVSWASCLSHFANKLISAEEIKDKCKNEVSWASCPSYFAYKLISAEEFKINVKMRRLVQLISIYKLNISRGN